MIWNWLSKKLGIKDYTSDLEKINSRVTNIEFRLQGIHEDTKENSDDALSIGLKLVTINNKLTSIEDKLNSLPKEVTVKNILSI